MTTSTEEPVSTRQAQILALIDRGFATDDIAEELGISPYTVRDQIRKLTGRFGGTLPELPGRVRAAGVTF